MRTTKITLRGVEYSLCLSTRVMMALEDRSGTFGDFMSSLTRIDNKMFLLEQLLRAGYVADRLEGLDPPEPPDTDVLMDGTDLDDYEAINEAITKCLQLGTDRKVEARAKKKAGGETLAG